MTTGRSRRPGRPPAANADETRRRIVQAARQVFSERGYDGATFQGIAARAGLTRPAINHYFPSKRALYRAVLEDTNRSVIGSGIKQAERESTLAGKLTAFITETMIANSDHPGGTAFLINGVLESQRHPELAGTENDSVRIVREFMLDAINDAIERGELVADFEVSAWVEAQIVLICGVGVYAGYVKSPEEMLALTGVMRHLLEGALRPTGA